jgi:hypothetical protein
MMDGYDIWPSKSGVLEGMCPAVLVLLALGTYLRVLMFPWGVHIGGTLRLHDISIVS